MQLKMAAVHLLSVKNNSDLASQCMNLCQAGQQSILTTPSHFPSEGDGSLTTLKKRKSPSILRRNARRSFWTRNLFLHLREKLLQWISPLKRGLKLETRKLSSVTNVTATSNLEMVWKPTSPNLVMRYSTTQMNWIATKTFTHFQSISIVVRVVLMQLMDNNSRC